MKGSVDARLLEALRRAEALEGLAERGLEFAPGEIDALARALVEEEGIEIVCEPVD